jgi:hypothetical protein
MLVNSKWRGMSWAGHLERMGARRVVCRILVGKSKGKRPLGRLGRRWEDNINIDLKEVECESMDWVDPT